MLKKQKALGRGLESLFAENETEEKNINDTRFVSYVRISDVEPDKNQPRKTFNDEALKSLADSIAEHGVLQPLVVRSAAPADADDVTKKLLDGKYRIISGERRWRASKLAGLTEVPVVVKELSDTEAEAVMLVENLQREDLNAVEIAKGLKRLIDEFGLTHEETAKIVGISRSNLTNSVRLLSLPENVLDFLASGDVTPGHARALLPLESETLINEALDIILSKQLSVRDTEKLVKNLTAKPDEKPKIYIDTEKKIYIDKLQETISSELGRKTVISADGRKKGSGKIVLEYYDDNDLEMLIKSLCGENIFKKI